MEKRSTLLLGLCLISAALFSQNIPQQQFISSKNVTSAARYFRATKLFGLPVTSDTTLNGGLDSLGSVIIVKSGTNGGVWYRDTISTGGHKWTKLGTSSYNFGSSDFTVSGSDVSLKYSSMQVGSHTVPGLLSTSLYDEFHGKQDALPSQSGNSGKVLTTDGTSLSWGAGSGSGSSTYAGLDDVSITSPSDSNFSVYNGTDWVNKTPADVKSILSLNNVENTKLSTWAGTGNVTILGTIASGTWHGTAIADTYIASANTWNAKEDNVTGALTPYLTTNATAAKVIISNNSGKLTTSDVSSAALGFIANLSSDAQTQLNGKEPAVIYSWQTIPYSTTPNYNCNNGYRAKITLTGDATISFSNFSNGHILILKVFQDGVGGRQLHLPAGAKILNGKGSGTDPILTPSPNAEDVLFIIKDGTEYTTTVSNNAE